MNSLLYRTIQQYTIKHIMNLFSTSASFPPCNALRTPRLTSSPAVELTAVLRGTAGHGYTRAACLRRFALDSCDTSTAWESDIQSRLNYSRRTHHERTAITVAALPWGFQNPWSGGLRGGSGPCMMFSCPSNEVMCQLNGWLQEANKAIDDV